MGVVEQAAPVPNLHLNQASLQVTPENAQRGRNAFTEMRRMLAEVLHV